MFRLILDGRRSAAPFEAIFDNERADGSLGGREVQQAQNFTAMSQASTGGASKLDLRQHPRPALILCRYFGFALEPDWFERET